VAVALTDRKSGDKVRLENEELAVNQDIPAAHKIALRGIRAGEQVIRYGSPIGTAKSAIEAGYWVHNHNLGSGLRGVGHYRYNPTAVKPRRTGSSPRSQTF
jgi:altronate hydrolase